VDITVTGAVVGGTRTVTGTVVDGVKTVTGAVVRGATITEGIEASPGTIVGATAGTIVAFDPVVLDPDEVILGAGETVFSFLAPPFFDPFLLGIFDPFLLGIFGALVSDGEIVTALVHSEAFSEILNIDIRVVTPLSTYLLRNRYVHRVCGPCNSYSWRSCSLSLPS
jgi:hypothetical protein